MNPNLKWKIISIVFVILFSIYLLIGYPTFPTSVAQIKDKANSLPKEKFLQFAKLFEEEVGTQEEFVAAPEEQLIDLVGSQPVALHQLAGQGLRVGEASEQGRRQLTKLSRFQQAVRLEGVEESGDGIDCHEVAGEQRSRALVSDQRPIVTVLGKGSQSGDPTVWQIWHHGQLLASFL